MFALGGVPALATNPPRPEPTNWFVGDMHVHRSCGGSPVTMASISNAMVAADLSVIALLADMGNGEVKDPVTDLPKVNGLDDASSPPGRIIHWDAEWHWDAVFYQTVAHNALGGHIVALGLTNATQLWRESTYPIIDWAQQQGGIAGFAHFQYLPDNSFPTTLDCCLPIEYPVEVALGSCDFISQDVAGTNAAMLAYYRLLNCGFRPGFAGGSDYPCNANIGAVTTFVKVDGPLTYRKWIEGIRDGRTVVSRNGRKEFLNFTVNTTNFPGDEITLPPGGGTVQVSVAWSAITNLSGTIDLVKNGAVITNKSASVSSNSSATLTASVTFTNSGWLAVRRMNGSEHQLQTGAIFVKVGSQPIRASVADAQFYVNWMDQLIARTQQGGEWGGYFTASNRPAVLARYQAARSNFLQIAFEAASQLPPIIGTTNLPPGAVNSPYAQTLAASRGMLPYQWTLLSGALPAGLTLATNGNISGVPATNGTANFSVLLTDSAIPAYSATQALSLTVYQTFPPTNLWSPATLPAVITDTDTNKVELGFKFQSRARGQVTGIRFYKGSSNTGTHTGHLWSSNGTLLASVTFSNETATGWQQALFSNPVAIAPDTTYVASYYAPNGRYSKTEFYFSSGGFTNYPLVALGNGTDGPNGVYRYGGIGFPTNTFNATHYWVDVVFQPNNAPVLPVQTNRTIPELTTLVVTNTATDPDVPANLLTYQLIGAPTNAAITTNGVISWTPSEAQGPSTNQIVTAVSDGVASVTNGFQVIVTEVNGAPVFAFGATNLSIPELVQFSFTNLATDADWPAQSLSYALINPPAGAAITNGIITWTPSEAQGPSTNTLLTVVSDGVVAATNQLNLTVLEVNCPPFFWLAPSNTTIPTQSSLVVSNIAADDDLPANALSYSLPVAPTNAVISPDGVISWSPVGEQAPSTNLFTTVVTDGASQVTNSFVVTVLAPPVAPTIISIQLVDGDAIITWTSSAGQNYILEYLEDFAATNWSPVLPGTVAAGDTTSATNATGGAPMRVYRLRSPE